jgi:hypothetical protein
MEFSSGEVEVLLPAESAWQTISAGMSFSVSAGATFQLRVHSISDYCCSYARS